MKAFADDSPSQQEHVLYYPWGARHRAQLGKEEVRVRQLTPGPDKANQEKKVNL